MEDAGEAPDSLAPLVARIVARIVELRRAAPAARSLLVALSGIDASGKGHVAARLAAALGGEALRTGVIGIDGWLRLPRERFSATDPGGHFYRHALRFEELFRDLVLPLKARRTLRLEADFAAETASVYRRHVWAFDDLDVILLEGVFLLQRAFQDGRYDLAVWIECSFETALARALARGQEGLGPEETVQAYRTIYFPAQELHLALDRPREAAEVVLVNDPRLGADQRGRIQTLR
ncbi:MAG TPA: uridine kinase [Planctomycetota bacterium]